MARSFVVQGLQAGCDMRSQEGLNAFMEQYNSNLPSVPLPRAPPDIRMVDDPGYATCSAVGGGARQRTSETKRKMQKASRRKNR